MEQAEARLRAFGEESLSEKLHGLLGETEQGLDTKSMSKLDLLHSYISHEMYHRGQISVYERLMKIEPAATAKLREFLAANP